MSANIQTQESTTETKNVVSAQNGTKKAKAKLEPPISFPPHLNTEEAEDLIFSTLEQKVKLLKELAPQIIPKVDCDFIFGKDDDDLTVISNDFQAVAEFCLVVAAKHIFDGHRINFKLEDAKKIQEPFKLFDVTRMYSGDLDYEQLEKEKDVTPSPPKRRGRQSNSDTTMPKNTPLQPKLLLEEIRKKYIAVPSPTKNDPDNTINTDISFIKLADVLFKTVSHTQQQYPLDRAPGDESFDPRDMFILFSGYFNTVAIEDPIVLDVETKLNARGENRCCVATGKEFSAGDSVQFYLFTLNRDVNETVKERLDDKTAAEFVHTKTYKEFIRAPFDNTSLKLRKWQADQIKANIVNGNKEYDPTGAPSATCGEKESRVADVIFRTLRFLRTDHFLSLEVKKAAEECLSAAQAVISHKVFEKQRMKKKVSSVNSSTNKNCLVTKKNKPDILEEKILAWYQFTQSRSGILRIVKWFSLFKQWQIQFIKSFWQLGTVIVPCDLDAMKKVQPELEVTQQTPAVSQEPEKKKAIVQKERKKVIEAEPEQEKVVEAEPEQEKVVEAEPEEEKVVEAEPKQEKVVEAAPEEEKVVEAEPEEEKVVEAEPEEEKVVEAEPEQEKVVEAEPEQEKVVEAEPEQEKVVEAEPEEEKVVEAEPEQEKVVEAEPKIEEQKTSGSKRKPEKSLDDQPLKKKVKQAEKSKAQQKESKRSKKRAAPKNRSEEKQEEESHKDFVVRKRQKLEEKKEEQNPEDLVGSVDSHLHSWTTTPDWFSIPDKELHLFTDEDRPDPLIQAFVSLEKDRSLEESVVDKLNQFVAKTLTAEQLNQWVNVLKSINAKDSDVDQRTAMKLIGSLCMAAGSKRRTLLCLMALAIRLHRPSTGQNIDLGPVGPVGISTEELKKSKQPPSASFEIDDFDIFADDDDDNDDTTTSTPSVSTDRPSDFCIIGHDTKKLPVGPLGATLLTFANLQRKKGCWKNILAQCEKVAWPKELYELEDIEVNKRGAGLLTLLTETWDEKTRADAAYLWLAWRDMQPSMLSIEF